MSHEDKQRYERESQDFKRGAFLGRNMTPLIKLPANSEVVSSALELNDDLFKFISERQASQSTGAN